jgi:hypothetical protein
MWRPFLAVALMCFLLALDTLPQAAYIALPAMPAMPAMPAQYHATLRTQDIYLVNQQQLDFANPMFQSTWYRNDGPVAAGLVKRSWYWGPAPISGALQEEYKEGVGGKRLVQYFDKARMEYDARLLDPNNPFAVTTGLLAVELISGKMQVGNSSYVDRWPADIPLASDPDDPNAPTYLSFRDVSNTPLGDKPAVPEIGQPVTATIARNGTVGADPTKAAYPDVTIAYYDETTRHNVPKAIWDFLHLKGPIFAAGTSSGVTNDVELSSPWFYATGLPISEAYWARVKILGQMEDVLIQAFERRVVTYEPNGPPGFQVEMGNIGQHYYDWRYKDAGKPAGWSSDTPTPALQPTAQPTVTVQLTTQLTATEPSATCCPPMKGPMYSDHSASQMWGTYWRSSTLQRPRAFAHYLRIRPKPRVELCRLASWPSRILLHKPRPSRSSAQAPVPIRYSTCM